MDSEQLYKDGSKISPITDASTVYVGEVTLDVYLEALESRLMDYIDESVSSINETLLNLTTTINNTITTKINTLLIADTFKETISDSITLEVNNFIDDENSTFYNKVADIIDTKVSDVNIDEQAFRSNTGILTYLDNKYADKTSYLTISDANTIYVKNEDKNKFEDLIRSNLGFQPIRPANVDDSDPDDKQSLWPKNIKEIDEISVDSRLKTIFGIPSSTSTITSAIIKEKIGVTELNNSVASLTNSVEELNSGVTSLDSSVNGSDNGLNSRVNALSIAMNSLDTDTLASRINNLLLTSSSLTQIIDLKVLDRNQSIYSTNVLTTEMLKDIKEELGLPRDITTTIDSLFYEDTFKAQTRKAIGLGINQLLLVSDTSITVKNIEADDPDYIVTRE